jgi:hypothetical protein
MTLNPFDDLDVLQSALRVTNAGDGLSDAMNIDPTENLGVDRVRHLIDEL